MNSTSNAATASDPAPLPAANPATNGVSSSGATSEANSHLSDEVRFAEAVESANVPTLLMVLVQLTGDLQWLEEPYRPRKARGLSDNESGGLAEDVQAEVRAASLQAIINWRNGASVVVPKPSVDLLIKMMGVAMGEEIPPEYAPMIAGELGLDDDVQTAARGNGGTVPEGFRAIIIGGGISGICAAIRLQQAGVDYIIIERNDDVGGVWLENTYPGAAVDTPSHLYAFSFAPNDWGKYFESQPSILAYLRKVADDFNVRSNVRFSTEVLRADYNEASSTWSVQVQAKGDEAGNSAETLTANIVISAVGAFNKPKTPYIKGAETFEGPHFHTANWPADLDLTGKRVAVVGNGASAMQVVPAIADQVESLLVFQHSPQWAGPFEKFKQPVPDAVRFLIANVPLYYSWYRARMAWIFNDRLYTSLQKDPDWPHPERSLNAINDAHRRQLTNYITEELGDRTDLLEKVLPTYPPFGKRMLLDNRWFRTITRSHVTVETSRLEEVRPHSVVAGSGEEYEVDVVVWATGFDVVRFLVPIEIVGRDGVRLHDAWANDDAKAFLGTAIPNFPNFFVLYGPNTQFGHGGSLITVMERQVHYLMTVLAQMFAKNVAALEVRANVHEDYNARIDEAHERMVWTHKGMDTYYRNARGRVVVNNPFRMQEFWQLTDRANLDDFVATPRG
jgi:4-hydroxyacetophenone monooxygenase